MRFFLIICATPLILLLSLLPLILEPLGSKALWDLIFISRIQGVLGVQIGEDIRSQNGCHKALMRLLGISDLLHEVFVDHEGVVGSL